MFAIFTFAGHRAPSTRLYETETEAVRDGQGYLQQYGYFVDVACNDHPDRPREDCPEPHDDDSAPPTDHPAH